MRKIIGLFVGMAMLAVPFISFANSTVTASAGTGATISPSGSVVVLTSAVQTFTFGALSGFRLSGVTVDGASQGVIDSYSLTGDLANHSITASATDESGGGMLSCSGPLAPGWNKSLPGGGCGGTGMFIPAGTGDCPFWFPSGCLTK